MGPIIYTTYGIAMGQRPETLANSGRSDDQPEPNRCASVPFA